MKPNLKTTKLPTEPSPYLHRAVQRALAVLFALLAVSAAVISFVFIFSHHYEGRIFPGTTVGSLDLSGMTYDQARTAVESSAGNVQAHGVTLRYGSTDVLVKSTAGDAANPELATPLYSYDPSQTIQYIITETSLRSEADRLYYWLTGWAVAPSVDIAAGELEQVLHEQLGQYEQPPVDARLTIAAESTLSITPETAGQTFDYPAILTAVRTTLERFSTDPIHIDLRSASPVITRASAAGAVQLAQQV
ncbi:MAG: peptidoglycan binding domain-containing protein, partial [Patescibacteria group bacterium]